MSRFLFTTLPSDDLGLLTRSLPIAKGLSKLKDEVVFCSPAKAPSKLIAESGFRNVTPRLPLFEIQAQDLTRKNLWSFLTSRDLRDKYGSVTRFLFRLFRSLPVRRAKQTPDIWNADHAAAMAGLMNRNFVQACCEAYMEVIQRSGCDYVVDFWNPTACIAARVLGKPLITVIQADAHPNSKGFIWWKEPPNNLPTALPTINKVMDGYGLKRLNKTEELSLGDLTLILGTPETDPLPEHKGCEYIGPLLWENPLARFPQEVGAIDDGKPLIWVYSGNPRYSKKGTVFDSMVIVNCCIDVLASLNVSVVLTTGHHQLPEEIGTLPDNFIHAGYVPGLAMARKCDLMIHHGGYGSCQTGLFTGTPAVIIPTFSERESNARRIASLGAGEFILPVTDGIEKQVPLSEFQRKVETVLSDPAYTENAGSYSKKLQAFGGVEKALELIQNFI
jgi:UDP:flavonoid glycosyltransferase YjiC (YdhE family)